MTCNENIQSIFKTSKLLKFFGTRHKNLKMNELYKPERQKDISCDNTYYVT